MSGRGRGRGGASRRAVEPAAGAPGRRSTRQQAQQQQSGDVPDSQIDPGLTATQNSGMGPPPLPTPRARIADIGRRGAPPGGDGEVSIVSIRPSSSQEPLSQESWPTPSRASRGRSVPRLSHAFEGTPRSSAARARKVAEMKDSLADLEKACRKFVANILSPADDVESWKHIYDLYKLRAQVLRELYISDGAALINIPNVLEQIGTDNPHAQRVCFMSNLMCLFIDIHEAEVNRDDVEYILENLLQGLDVEFPKFYIDKDDRGNYILPQDQLFGLVLDIRSQLFIFTLRLHHESGEMVNPLEKAKAFFFDADAPVEAITRLITTEDNPPRSIKLVEGIQEHPEHYYQLAAKRVVALCKDLPTSECPSIDLDLKGLQEDFRFDEFLESLKSAAGQAWNALAAYPPLSSWTPALSQSHGGTLSPSAQLAREAYSQSTSQSQDDFSGIIRGLAETNYFTSENRFSSQDILGEHAPSNTFPPVPAVSYPSGLPYGEPSGQANGRMYAQSAADTARKRRREPDDAEAAPPRKARGRRKQPAVSVPASSVPPAPSQYPAPPSSAIEPDYEKLAQKSREISAANRKSREPQQRSAWTRNDTRALVKAVDVYKCKWSTIEREILNGDIPFEVRRDQQALRDKARLLKQDFLKTDSVLPPSFDLVVLGKKEKNAVIAVGKNPYRKESDVDANGMPVNTAYIPEGDAVVAQAVQPVVPPESIASDIPGQVPEAPMEEPNNPGTSSEVPV